MNTFPVYSFTLTGTMPLLMHSGDVRQGDTLSKWRKDSKNKSISVPGDDRSPAWTWMTYLYTDHEKVAMPSMMIMAALRNGGSNITLKGMKTYKATTQTGLIIYGTNCEFQIPDHHVRLDMIEKLRDEEFECQLEMVEKAGFTLDMRRATVGSSQHVRVRPRFDQWTVKGQIEIHDASLTPDILAEIFTLAGKSGIGDWRPTSKRPGPFGTFSTILRKQK